MSADDTICDYDDPDIFPVMPTQTEKEIVVEEIFQQLNCVGAQLCNFECYSRTVPPLQEAYGHEAVAAALHKNYAVIRARAADQIRCLRRNAARLKRELGRK